MKGFDHLLEEMKSALIVLQGIPEGQEFTIENTDILDQVRLVARNLQLEIEAILKILYKG